MNVGLRNRYHIATFWEFLAEDRDENHTRVVYTLQTQTHTQTLVSKNRMEGTFAISGRLSPKNKIKYHIGNSNRRRPRYTKSHSRSSSSFLPHFAYKIRITPRRPNSTIYSTLRLLFARAIHYHVAIRSSQPAPQASCGLQCVV